MRATKVIHAFGGLISLISGEYLLTRFRYPNGGTVVFLRSLHVTFAVLLLGMGLQEALDPAKEWIFSWRESRRQLQSHVTWMGPIFAAVYALLYARFSSQWTYMANLYNQIKASQIREKCDPVVLAEWRAGFIEDCYALHLLKKPMFASIANEWLSEQTPGGAAVRQCFAEYTPNGKALLPIVEAEVADAMANR